MLQKPTIIWFILLYPAMLLQALLFLLNIRLFFFFLSSYKTVQQHFDFFYLSDNVLVSRVIIFLKKSATTGNPRIQPLALYYGSQRQESVRAWVGSGKWNVWTSICENPVIGKWVRTVCLLFPASAQLKKIYQITHCSPRSSSPTAAVQCYRKRQMRPTAP